MRIILFLTLVVAAALSLAPLAQADHCVRQRVLVQQAVVAKAVVADTVLVPKAVAVAVSPDYYYSVADHYRDSLLADAITQRVVQRLQASGNVASPPETTAPNGVCQCNRPPAPNSPPANPPAGSTPAKLVAVVKASCLKCHSGANVRGGLDLSNLDTVPEGVRWKAYSLVNTGEMPQGAAAIGDEDVKLFYEWAKSAKK